MEIGIGIGSRGLGADVRGVRTRDGGRADADDEHAGGFQEIAARGRRKTVQKRLDVRTQPLFGRRIGCNVGGPALRGAQLRVLDDRPVEALLVAERRV